ARLVRRLEPRARGFRRVVRFSLPLLIGGLGAVAGGRYYQVARAEQWALADLPAPRQGGPNVLFLVMGTVRADHLRLHRCGRDTPPNLTRLARRSVRFEHARAASSWTLPSHASMFTGRLPHELRVFVNRPLDGTYPTLAEFLRDRGYMTAGFVAN